MNERIRELVEQVGTDTSGKWISVDRINELVKLTVGECVSITNQVRADYEQHRRSSTDFNDKNIYAEGEAASDIIKYKMKKHFGVDE